VLILPGTSFEFSNLRISNGGKIRPFRPGSITLLQIETKTLALTPTDLTPPNPAAVRIFVQDALPTDRPGAEAAFSSIADALLVNVRSLNVHSTITPEEAVALEVAVYLWSAAWVSAPNALERSLSTMTEVFFRNHPEWRSQEAHIRHVLRSDTFRDAVIGLDAKKEIEEQLLLRNAWAHDEKEPSNSSWLRGEIERLRSLRLGTSAGQIRFGKRLEKNIEELESLCGVIDGVRSSGQRQKMTLTIYRTISRNMIDMLTLADRKAGLLLNANAISLTVMVSFFGRSLAEHPKLWASSVLIAGTCALTVIFASLAARPLKRDRKKMALDTFVGEGLSFLHYGDVARLKREDFLAGWKKASNNPEVLENDMLSELHFFAVRISDKFRMVRRAYLTMITGIVLSCLALLSSQFL
jgi:hypothetical protein